MESCTDRCSYALETALTLEAKQNLIALEHGVDEDQILQNLHPDLKSGTKRDFLA